MKKHLTLTTLLTIISSFLFSCGGVTPVPPPTPTPTLSIGSTIVSEKDGMVMLFVPQGEFIMGEGGSIKDREFIHKVYLDSYWIDQTEVTNTMYAKCVSSGVCKEPQNRSTPTRSSYYGDPNFGDYPVVYVDWYMAKTYCEWRGDNLPTEAQWEKAARTTDGRTYYPWGKNIIACPFANYWGNDRRGKGCVGDTTKVASYEIGKSPYGLYDMTGNVLEWVMDWYSDTYYQNSPLSNPPGPEMGIYRVQRSGAWNYDNFDVRSSNRLFDKPVNIQYNIGFRCAHSIP